MNQDFLSHEDPLYIKGNSIVDAARNGSGRASVWFVVVKAKEPVAMNFNDLPNNSWEK